MYSDPWWEYAHSGGTLSATATPFSPMTAASDYNTVGDQYGGNSATSAQSFHQSQGGQTNNPEAPRIVALAPELSSAFSTSDAHAHVLKLAVALSPEATPQGDDRDVHNIHLPDTAMADNVNHWAGFTKVSAEFTPEQEHYSNSAPTEETSVSGGANKDDPSDWKTTQLRLLDRKNIPRDPRSAGVEKKKPSKWAERNLRSDGTRQVYGGDAPNGSKEQVYRSAKWDTPAKTARAITQLRQLLDFYFEPFNLQHNRYLLDLIARRVGSPDKSGPWLADAMFEFKFSIDDLLGLGRIASALGKIRVVQAESLLPLKHLECSRDGQLQLRAPPEVRSFVQAKGVHPTVVASAVRFLTSVREERGQAPPGIVSLLSYALGETIADPSPRGQQRQAQYKRQLLLHHTDIMCLQGLDPEGDGAGLTTTLADDGYCYAFARSSDGTEANSIFWDAGRLKLEWRVDHEAAIAIDLSSFENPNVVFRVVCVRPAVPTTCADLSELFLDRRGPLVVCSDLTLLGGAESACIVEELAGLPSLSWQVLGSELLAPLSAQLPDGGGLEPVITGASLMNTLRSPDAVLFDGLEPILALSGHTETYMATMAKDDLVQQFPAFHIPIVAAFNWHAAQTQGTAAPAPAFPIQ